MIACIDFLSDTEFIIKLILDNIVVRFVCSFFVILF